MPTPYQLEVIELAGTPEEMGERYGTQLAKRIRRFVEHRLAITGRYLADRGFAGEADLLAAGLDGLRALEVWHPAGFTELVATARAADVAPEALFAAANYSDLRDVVLLGDADHADQPIPARGETAADEGCTAFALAPTLTRTGEIIAGQTWDLHPGDVDHVIAVRRTPVDARATVSITTVGSPTLIGLNDAGVFVGTTNIKVRSVRRDGVGYLNTLHRALAEAGTAEDAARIVARAPRLAAHTFWAADRETAVEIEASATHLITRRLEPAGIADGLGGQLILQTNHCLDEQTRSLEAERPSESSTYRRTRALELIAPGGHDAHSLRAVMADRENAPFSINRYHEDEQYAATNACAIAEPARRLLHACRGPADRGVWIELKP